MADLESLFLVATTADCRYAWATRAFYFRYAPAYISASSSSSRARAGTDPRRAAAFYRQVCRWHRALAHPARPASRAVVVLSAVKERPAHGVTTSWLFKRPRLAANISIVPIPLVEVRRRPASLRRWSRYFRLSPRGVCTICICQTTTASAQSAARDLEQSAADRHRLTVQGLHRTHYRARPLKLPVPSAPTGYHLAHYLCETNIMTSSTSDHRCLRDGVVS